MPGSLVLNHPSVDLSALVQDELFSCLWLKCDSDVVKQWSKLFTRLNVFNFKACLLFQNYVLSRFVVLKFPFFEMMVKKDCSHSNF